MKQNAGIEESLLCATLKRGCARSRGKQCNASVGTPHQVCCATRFWHASAGVTLCFCRARQAGAHAIICLRLRILPHVHLPATPTPTTKQDPFSPLWAAGRQEERGHYRPHAFVWPTAVCHSLPLKTGG
eukprot:gene17269-biopygen8317